MKKTFAIGDIHGEFSLAKALIDKLPIDWDNDRIIFLGDYIDRGSEIRETIEWLKSLKGDVIFLRGNHEDMFLDYYKGINIDIFLHNGGKQTLAQVEDIQSLYDFIMKRTVLWFEDEKYFYVHAGLQPNMSIEENKRDWHEMLWIRNKFLISTFDWGKKVVVGHTPSREVLIEKNKICIDTGAFYYGCLSAIELPKEKVYQIYKE